MNKKLSFQFPMIILTISLVAACNNTGSGDQKDKGDKKTAETTAPKKYLSKPLVTHIYTADPSAHIFNEKIYIYPSHDYEAGVPEDDLGSHFAMRDFHVLSMDSINGNVTDHGVALDIKDIPWAKRQLWVPDAAFKNGTYYLYFPVKDKSDIFRIGVATSSSPTGPFKPEAAPIKGSYSIDPAVFKDTDGTHYMYFGGIWGGQLQRWSKGTYDSTAPQEPAENTALSAKVAKLSADMKSFDGPVKDVQILDEAGKSLQASDHNRRFFEGGWMHKYKNKYYFSYSTGDTHFLAYAVGDNPYGPFTYKGVLMNPVEDGPLITLSLSLGVNGTSFIMTQSCLVKRT